MLNLIICLGGVAGILAASQIMWNRHILRGERERKFIHVLVGAFVASWPWLISWRSIQLISAAMFIAVLANHRRQTLHVSGGVKRTSYGEIFFALAIVLCASLTGIKIFFALAILQMALADGAAALVGKRFGEKTKYKFLGTPKTWVGSAAFIACSFSILAAGLLAASSYISYGHYVQLCLFLPPVLTALEGMLGFGLDNLAVPLATIVALRLVS